MKNQKSIQILRGTREKILKNKDEKLLKGQPLYNLTDNTLSIGDENSNIDKLPIATNELHGNIDGIKSTNAQGVYDYSISYVDNKGISIKNNVKYDGESIILSNGLIGTQKGDIIPGAEATGIQAMAFGGKRWNYLNLEGTIKERDVTKAIGNQSFAAGGSVQAHGDFSVALNKDTRAYQSSSMAIGGGTQAGRSKKEFEEYYYDAENQVAINNGLGLNDKNEVLDADGKTYEQTYSFAFAAGSTGKALGYSSTKLGGDNESIGNFSLTSGDKCYAYANYQTILGHRNTGLKNAPYLIISGQNNESDCYAGAVFGTDHRINGSVNLAAGLGNIITTGTKNTILNSGNKIISGNNQYVGGYENVSSFSGAFVHGHRLTSSAYYQAVLGKYNKDNGDALLIVGNGTGDADRKNAFEVLTDGIKTSSIADIGSNNTIYFESHLNGDRKSSIWANDISILLDGVDGKYTNVGSKLKSLDSGKSNKSYAGLGEFVTLENCFEDKTIWTESWGGKIPSGTVLDLSGWDGLHLQESEDGFYLSISISSNNISYSLDFNEVYSDGASSSTYDIMWTKYVNNKIVEQKILATARMGSYNFEISWDWNNSQEQLQQLDFLSDSDYYEIGGAFYSNVSKSLARLIKYKNQSELKTSHVAGRISDIINNDIFNLNKNKSDIYIDNTPYTKFVSLNDCGFNKANMMSWVNGSVPKGSTIRLEQFLNDQIGGFGQAASITRVTFKNSSYKYVVDISPYNSNGSNPYRQFISIKLAINEGDPITLADVKDQNSKWTIYQNEFTLPTTGGDYTVSATTGDDVPTMCLEYSIRITSTNVDCEYNFNKIKDVESRINSSSCGVEQVVFTPENSYGISNKLVGIKPKEESDQSDRTAYYWNNLAPYDAATPWWYAQNILQGEEHYGVCTSFDNGTHGWAGRAFDVVFGVNIQGELYYFTHFIDTRWGIDTQVPFNILLNNNTIVNGAVCLAYIDVETSYRTVGIIKAAIQINGSTTELTPSTDSEQQNTIWIAHRIAWNEFGA